MDMKELHNANLKNNEITKLISDEIVKQRQLKKLTQKKLSNLLDLSIQQIQKYEYGETNISIYRLIKIADALNIGVLDILQPALKIYYQTQNMAQYVLHDPVETEICTRMHQLSKSKKDALLRLLQE